MLHVLVSSDIVTEHKAIYQYMLCICIYCMPASTQKCSQHNILSILVVRPSEYSRTIMSMSLLLMFELNVYPNQKLWRLTIHGDCVSVVHDEASYVFCPA